MATFTELVVEELARTRKAHAVIRTRHEGLAVIEEEFLELRAEVFQREPHPEKLLAEFVQVAAMAQRVAEDLWPALCQAEGDDAALDLRRTLLAVEAKVRDAIELSRNLVPLQPAPEER
jgi:hypothetical protein